MNNSFISCIVAALMQSEVPEVEAICPISVLVTKTAEHSLSNRDHKAELKTALTNFSKALGVNLRLSAMINSVESAEFATYKINFSSEIAAKWFTANVKHRHVFADEITLEGREVTMRAAGEQGNALEAIMKAHKAFAKQVSSR